MSHDGLAIPRYASYCRKWYGATPVRMLMWNVVSDTNDPVRKLRCYELQVMQDGTSEVLWTNFIVVTTALVVSQGECVHVAVTTRSRITPYYQLITTKLNQTRPPLPEYKITGLVWLNPFESGDDLTGLTRNVLRGMKLWGPIIRVTRNCANLASVFGRSRYSVSFDLGSRNSQWRQSHSPQ